MLRVISTLQAPVIHTRGSIKIFKKYRNLKPCLKKVNNAFHRLRHYVARLGHAFLPLEHIFPATVLVSCYNYHFNKYFFNPLRTNSRLLNFMTHFAPCSKHFSSWLQKPISLCCKWHKSLIVLR